MGTNFNRNARLAGVLFLLTMAVAIAANLIIVNLLAPDDYLVKIAANQNQPGYAGLLMMINCLGIIGIGALLYPIIASANRSAAVLYMSARIFEAALLTLGIISILTLGSLASETSGETSGLYAMANVAVRTNWFAYHGAMAALGLGSIPFCYILFKNSMIPRVLSGLGIVAYLILFLSSLLAFTGIEAGIASTIAGFVFEVSFGFWLVLKGISRESS
ncbi:DUF4386 domain-containing protein [Roseivirga sp.]|uniref:DUF4386 domain-containing protein n=1 Tax=Roseivirga sp. TaxID=1964215 RepID=UPI003B52C541